MYTRFIALTAAALLAGCKSPVADTTRSASLTGTGWQLIQFQSSDDTIGTMRPADPVKYQMMLLPNGELAMKLDCNRGTGKWSYSTSGNNRGSLSLSPVAMTRAMCAPGSMDTKIARDAAFVRGYVLNGDRLSLSLEADGGIYTWERIPE